MERYFIDEKKFEELKAFEVKPKDLIISCSGVTLGRIAEIPLNAPKGIINQALLKLTLDSNKMNNTFLSFYSAIRIYRIYYLVLVEAVEFQIFHLCQK